MREQYTRSGHGFIIVYDITNAESFREAKLCYEWCARIKGDKQVYAVSYYLFEVHTEG